MGKIEIDIPKDLEQALDAAFPGEDKATLVLRLLQAEIADYPVALGAEASSDASELSVLIADVLRARSEPPFASDVDIRRAREALRE